MIVRSKDEWVYEMQSQQKLFIFYQGYCLDMQGFIGRHPGGPQVIKPYLGQDVTSIIFEIFPQNPTVTGKMLEKYRVGKVQTSLIRNGAILKKQKKNIIEKQNRIVQFPSDIAKLASEKERQQLQKLKGSSRSKPKRKISKRKAKQIEEINKKYINPTYAAVLRGDKISKVKGGQNSKQEKIDAIRQESVRKIDKAKSMQTSLGYVIKGIEQRKQIDDCVAEEVKIVTCQSCTAIRTGFTYSDFPLSSLDEEKPTIRVPIMKIKIHRIW